MQYNIFIGQIAVYGTGKYFERFIGFLLLPVFTRLLTVEEYGAIDMINIYMTLCMTAVSLNLEQGSVRFFYEYQDENKRRTVISTAMNFMFLWCVLAIFALILATPYLTEALGIEAYQYEFKVANLGLFLVIFVKYFQTILRFTFRAKTFVLSNLTGVGCIYVSAVIFIRYYHLQVGGYIIGNLLGQSILFIILFHLVREHYIFRIDGKELRKMLNYSIPLVPFMLLIALNNAVSRLILQRFHGLTEVGLFSVANKIAIVALFAVYAFQSAWSPFAFSINKEPGAKEVYIRTFNYFIFTMGVLIWFLTIGAFEIVSLLTPAVYIPSNQYVFLLCISNMFFGLFSVVSFGTMVIKKTTNMIYAIAGGVAVNLVLSYIMGKPYGMLGVSLANAAGWIISLATINWLTQKVYRIEFQWKRLWLTFVPIFCCWLLLYYLDLRTFSWTMTIVKILLTGAYGAYLYIASLIPVEALKKLLRTSRAL